MRSARPALALAAICGGCFMVILDTTVVNAALAALRQDLGTSVSGLQGVVNGYAGVPVEGAAFLSAWAVALLAVDRGRGHARQRVAA